jgi:hypothetical protein
VRDELRERLLSLHFDAFARCVALLLERADYQDVRSAGRVNARGRNRRGGIDLIAALPPTRLLPGAGPLRRSPAAARAVVVQLKQYAPDRAVFQRQVDELRGACLRAGASEAVLITTSSFSPSVRAADPSGAILAPVRLVDGQTLVDLLVSHGLGIVSFAGKEREVPAHLSRVDHAFFDELTRLSRGRNRDDCGGDAGGVTGELLVTISFRPVPPDRPEPSAKKTALPLRRQGRRARAFRAAPLAGHRD